MHVSLVAAGAGAVAGETVVEDECGAVAEEERVVNGLVTPGLMVGKRPPSSKESSCGCR